jgi:6-pyruvoyl tetrahydropterin synthase/QueD family protein
MRLEREYVAEIAHQLSAGVPEGHPCRRLHGHRYEIVVTIIGDVNPETGMILEYAEIDRRVHEVFDLLDHRFINFLGEEAAVTTDPTTPFAIVATRPIEGARILEPALAAKVRENSTIENVKLWFEAELKHRFPRKNFMVGKTSFQDPTVYTVEIKEDPRSSVS